ncbi:O-acyltransferase like protein-like [Oppia nitens]|uniref:O-acyltransferase like protein-like n=1 Tax=Oppia nitens TaxID=1686743 RepID=UPI0023DA64EA|nr:O-acyltransferase like protein-like [Oppia nitens]
MNYTSIIGSGFVGYRNVHNSYLLNIVNETKYFWLRTLFHKDMILVISGIYISYDFFGDKQIPLTVWQYIRFVGEKWYRLTVKMLASLLVFNLLSLIGSGPLWNTGYPTFVESCSQNYWANLLFISNLIHESSQLCNPGTWFILLIFQLHIISPLFLVPFKISPHFGYIFNLIAFLLTCVVNILQKLLLNLKAMPYEAAEVHTAIEMRQSIMRLFGFPDQYISIFIVGIVFGYIMRNKNQLDNLVKNIHVKFVNSIICYSLFIAVIAWSENFKDMNVIQNKYNFNLWFTFGKVFWTIANLWLMYDVLSKDMFQVLLSSSLFGVILRLSYGILLIGPIVIGYRKLTLRDTVPLRHSAQIEHLIMDIALMIVISYLMYIFIEYPLIKLLNIFKNKKLDKKQNNLIVKSTQTAIDENSMLSNKSGSQLRIY